ncbi:MAG: hypothetical protein ACLR4Z_05655 [Butyricicoccaceae bacterium]
MISFDRREALRYMGYHGAEPDAAVAESLERCAAELQTAVQPKSISARFPLSFIGENTMQIGDLTVTSANLARNLRGCTEVYLMAATLGIGADRLIARASAVRMSDAVILQAVAAASDRDLLRRGERCAAAHGGAGGAVLPSALQSRLRRFSIEHQRDFSRLLDTPRKIGLTVTESCLLAPIKSVTAVIGLSPEKQDCHRKGCEECGKTDCNFRR